MGLFYKKDEFRPIFHEIDSTVRNLYKITAMYGNLITVQ